MEIDGGSICTYYGRVRYQFTVFTRMVESDLEVAGADNLPLEAGYPSLSYRRLSCARPIGWS